MAIDDEAERARLEQLSDAALENVIGDVFGHGFYEVGDRLTVETVMMELSPAYQQAREDVEGHDEHRQQAALDLEIAEDNWKQVGRLVVDRQEEIGRFRVFLHRNDLWRDQKLLFLTNEWDKAIENVAQHKAERDSAEADYDKAVQAVAEAREAIFEQASAVFQDRLDRAELAREVFNDRMTDRERPRLWEIDRDNEISMER